MLPLGFHRIRYDGFLAPRHRAEKLTHCRQLLVATSRLAVAAPLTRDPIRTDGRLRISTRLCPACGQGHLMVIDRLPPTPRISIPPDTS